MQNIHPIYHIKEMMIKKELSKDEKLKDENWDRFLPNYKKKISSKKAGKKNINTKKEYTPWAPEPTKRKEDYLMETGEYFLSKDEKEQASKAQRKPAEVDSKVKDKKDKKAEKLKRFDAPDVEDEIKKDQARKNKILGKREGSDLQKTDTQEINKLKKKFKIDSGAFAL